MIAVSNEPLFYNPQTTLLDHPNKVSYMVFTRKCNWNCYGCHNIKQLRGSNNVPISLDELIDKINNPMIELLIVSGGESLLQGDVIIDALEYIRSKSLKPIRIDTNGTCPDMATHIAEDGLCDGFAVDVKLPYWKMLNKVVLKEILGVNDIYVPDILKTMQLADTLPFTLFRTVKYPVLPDNLLEEITNYISKYYQSPHYINPYYKFDGEA